MLKESMMIQYGNMINEETNGWTELQNQYCVKKNRPSVTLLFSQ